MKIVDATWEKRNLDIRAVEVHLAENEVDDFLLMSSSLEREYDYLLLKIPVGDIGLLIALQENGFFFAETIIKCQARVDSLRIKPIYTRVLNFTSAELASKEEQDLIKTNIKKEMFVTDRISLDPRFGANSGANRYVGMLEDEQRAGGKLFVLKFRDECAGFFTLKKKPDTKNVYVAALGGIFPEFQNIGLGAIMNILELNSVANMGGQIVETAFSTNNRAAMATHLELGYNLISQEYVLVKHARNYEQH